ncbi:glutamate--tRNA ligase [Acidobacteriota bacterium]
MIRVRFAPSPTGFLHIGAARTALFNWMYSKNNEGKFILRIEDTDLARSSEEMSREIVEGLKWLGMEWDEGPIYQSQRIKTYQKRARDLVEKNCAYFCYCLPEEIKERREAEPDGGKSWVYDRRCCHLTPEEKAAFESVGRSRAIRFLVPQTEIRYKDLIHGEISVLSETIEDFVLLRNDGLPTYHLSVVVDDIECGITHVIRGDDHISNTPKQILLYRAMDIHPPKFAHLALILGPDKKKLSKRHGVTSVLQFKREGYLPLAVVNFLAQLSWSPGEGQSLFSLDEMVRRFTLKKLSKGSPVYDPERLNWLNGQLISKISADELFPHVRRQLEKDGLWEDSFDLDEKPRILKIIDILKQRNRTILDFSSRMKPFLSETFDYEPEGIGKYLQDERLGDLLEILAENLEQLDHFSAEEIETVLRNRAEIDGVKAALLIHAVRMLVLGMGVSPGIFEVLELVGRESVVARMRKYPQVKTLH